MRQARLTREETSAQGTFGTLETDSGLKLATGELPWRLNEGGKSCIIPGEYPCNWRFSPKHDRKVYHVDKVAGRSDIEIHAGNYCGDVAQDFKSDVLGCILLGGAVGDLTGQRGVLRSKKAIADFEDDMQGADFKLIVGWADGIGPASAN